jgi:TolB-like protein
LAYKGRAVDIREVGREQGVQYVLEGSVRSDSQRVRVTAQLIELERRVSPKETLITSRWEAIFGQEPTFRIYSITSSPGQDQSFSFRWTTAISI